MRYLFIVYEGSGLGHLRRLGLIANMLVSSGHEALIVTGHRAAATVLSPSIEFIKLPSINQLISSRAEYWGYAPSFRISRSKLLGWRKAILDDIANRYKPDIVAVDHRPFGKNMELMNFINKTRAKCVLFLRGILGEESEVKCELEEDFKHPLMEKFTHIFACCDMRICDMVKEYNFLHPFKEKMSYIGFILPPKLKSVALERYNRLGSRHEDIVWAVISCGGGKYYSLSMNQIVSKCVDVLSSEWHIDIVHGPYSRYLDINSASVLRPNIEVHKSIENLSNWHQAANVIITTGGLNTILEGISGGSKIFPVINEFNKEITILCNKLYVHGYCYKPLNIEELIFMMKHYYQYPQMITPLTFCRSQELLDRVNNVLCEDK